MDANAFTVSEIALKLDQVTLKTSSGESLKEVSDKGHSVRRHFYIRCVLNK